MKSIREIMIDQRQDRSPDIEIALQDFLELTSAEQTELLFVGLFMTVRDAEWAKNAVAQILKERGR